ncbi:hypothetical protein FRC02_000111 [Tulasnella sp. 418]|nr:hypothetical protein FRC02_000111 [Tulasnella sp. 418]
MCMPIPVISGVGLNTAAAGSSYRYGLAAFGTSPDLTSSTSQHDVKGKSKSVEETFDEEERPNIPPTSCDDYAVRSSAVDFGISDMPVPTVKDAQHTPHSANKPSQSSTCRIENLRNPVTTGLKDEPKRIHFGASLSSFIDDDKKLNAKEVTRTGLEQFDPFLQLKSRFGDVVGAPVAEMFPPETPIRDLGLITPSPTHRETLNRTHSLPEKLSDCIRDNGRKRRDSHVRFMEGDEPFGPHRLNRDSRRLASYPYPRPSPYPYQSVVSSGMSHQPVNQLPPHAAVLTSRALHQSNSSHSLPPKYSFMRGPFSFAERPSDGRPGSNFDEFTLVAPGKNEAFNQGGTSELDASADYFVIALSRSDSAVYQFKDVLGQLLIRWINWFVLEERDRFYYKREDEERGWIRTMITALMIVVVIQVLVCFSLIQHGLELGGKLLGVDVRSAFRGRSRWGQNPRA